MRDATSRRFCAAGRLVLLSLVAGIGYAAMLMGGRPLHPSDLGWMKGDPVEHYLGWLFYQQTSDNSFPLTWSDRLGYPYGGYLSLTDPAILMLLGWVRHLIPPGLQFFGWLFAFNAALLFFWGWKLIAEMAEQLPLKPDVGTKLLACLTGALLLLWLPEFGVAAIGNYCSQFQWPVVASLYFLVRADSSGNPWRWCWPFWLLIFIAALMHPYAGAITALVGFGGWLRLVPERRIGMVPAVGLFLALPLSLAAPLALDGVLLVGNGAQAGGFQDYSFNLLGFFNGQFFLPLMGWNSPVFEMQGYAGYAYLGLGVFSLLLALLVRLGLARPSMRRLLCRWSPKAVALAIVLLLCLVIALSNRVTLGRHVLFEYGLSGPFLFLSNAFRVPGRFTWPIQDFLVAATVIAVLRCHTANMARGLLIVALLLQFIDLAPLWSYVKGYIEEPAQGFLQDFDWDSAVPGPSPVWTHLGETHRHLVVLPAWQCDNSGTPRGMRGQAIFGRLAAEQGMTVNSYRASRYSGDSMAYHCQTLPAQVAAGEMDANSAYVLGDTLFLRLARSGGSKTHHCDLVDGLILCRSRPVPDGNWQSVMAPLPQGQSPIGDQR